MSHPKELQESLEKFRSDHPNPGRVAFLMMNFEKRDFYPQLVEALKLSFEKQKITLLRADDKEYHSNLLLNIRTYMHGCGFGVAVYDKVSKKNFNPNVSMEVGYMLAMNKEILFLKNKDLDNLNEDLLGTLYKNFNTYKIQETIPKNVNKWLDDKGFCYKQYHCYITLSITVAKIASCITSVDSIVEDIKGYALSDEKPKLLRLYPSAESNNAILVFEGDIDFYEGFKKLHANNRIHLSNNEISIIDVSSKPHTIIPSDIINPFSTERNTTHSEKGWTWQICRREGWDGDRSVIGDGKLILGEALSYKIEDSKVYLTISSDNYLVAVSNHINFSHLYSTKIRAPLWLKPHFKVRILDIITSIVAFEDLTIKPTLREIIYANVKSVAYFIDNKNSKEILELVDFCGAENVEVV